MAGEDNPLDAIWKGDMLKRREEARLLERFLVAETEALAAQGREQAVVLALDAQYGQGKSWFLQHFKAQLTLNHPIAFVDAWVDDANNEPLVSIMAALEDCLRPFLTTPALKEKMAGLARAALPIMGKAVVGAAGKFVGKYVGEQFGDDTKEMLRRARAKEKSVGEEAAEAAFDAVTDGVSEVVDAAGKAMLDQFRERQKSRETFKSNLKVIADTLRTVQEDGKQGPIFIVVDELDRCRPNYAIALLEDIKHLFDVPGVVFVIALHSGQLQESVKAIYGVGFNGADYLRRFFTRHYELRQLAIGELVSSQFEWVGKPGVKLESPPVFQPQGIGDADPVELTGALLTEWRATPREVLSILDGLRLFIADWNYDQPIELPLVLGLLFHFVRGQGLVTTSPSISTQQFSFALQAQNGAVDASASSKMYHAYSAIANSNLADVMAGAYHGGGPQLYVQQKLRVEFNQRFGGKAIAPDTFLYSTWSEYPDRVRNVGRFIEAEEAAKP